MAAVNFRLRKPTNPDGSQKTEPVSIQVWYYHSGIEAELATGIKVLPSQWNGNRVTNHPKANRINKVLSELEASLFNVHIDHRNKTKVEHAAIVRALIKGDPIQEEKKTVETWIDKFIKESKKKPATVQVYRVSFDHLKKYASLHNLNLTWDSFNLDFYEDFVEYLYNIGHNDNTVGKTIKTLKTFISEAFERDEHANLAFKKKGFKAISAEIDEVYLSEAEIIQFYNTDLNGDQSLEQSKKRFVFNCWAGLRFGDLSRINPNHITKGLKGGLMLKVTTEKTGEDVMIPLHPMAEEIWNSWAGIPPKSIENQTFNQHIKTIAQEAKLNSVVQRRNTIKGQVKIEWVPKYEMIKAHTCRRSFATNCYLMGIPSRTIMAVTGHRTEKAFLKYIRVTKEQHASIMMEYFNKPKKDEETVMKKAN